MTTPVAAALRRGEARRGDDPRRRRIPLAIRGSTVPSLGLAVAADLVFGEPPEPLHPVVWIGRLVGAALPPDPPAVGPGRRLRGATVVAATTLAGAAVGVALDGVLRHPRVGRIAEAAALWPLLSLRALTTAADGVATALEAGDLAAARSGLRWLVGRPTEDLDGSLCASAAIESVAENLADAVVAPLLYARLGGLPAALVHRVANTADAMVGYVDSHRHGGWAAARLDDLLAFLPARIAALGIVAAAPAGGGDPGRALELWRRDAPATRSPNAGHPMAAMAGALGVRLEKPGYYVLHSGGRPPGPAEVRAAIVISRTAALLALLLCALIPRPGRPRGGERRAAAAAVAAP